MKVELTKSQCENLAFFIEANLLEEIRNDVDIDNLNWLRDMLDAHKVLEEAAKSEES